MTYNVQIWRDAHGIPHVDAMNESELYWGQGSDLATDECYSNMAGGSSDRRFSKWYCSDLENWLAGKYKTLSTKTSQQTFLFK